MILIRNFHIQLMIEWILKDRWTSWLIYDIRYWISMISKQKLNWKQSKNQVILKKNWFDLEAPEIALQNLDNASLVQKYQNEFPVVNSLEYLCRISTIAMRWMSLLYSQERGKWHVKWYWQIKNQLKIIIKFVMTSLIFTAIWTFIYIDL